MAANLFSKTPMWVGWNTERYSEPIKKQVTRYMQNIRLPPTREDVVKETLKRSQEVAKKCGHKYAIATSDLAVPKTQDKFTFKILQNLMTVSYSLVNST